MRRSETIAIESACVRGVPPRQVIMTNPTPSFPTLAPELGASHEDPIHQYNAIELTANRRFADNWMLTSSYRWSRLHGCAVRVLIELENPGS